MKIAIRILLIVVVIEAVAATAAITWRFSRTEAQLPAVTLNDPLTMPQLRELADAAEAGGARDWTRLGEALVGKGFYGHAELAFREALQRNPGSFAARFGLAFCLDRTGRTQESSQEYQQALGSSVGNFELPFAKYYASYALGRNALRRENTINALDHFDQNADFAPAAYQQAKLLIRAGKAEQALPIIEQNLARIPFSLEFHFLRMQAMQALGRPDEAFESALKLERSAPLVSMNFSTDYVAPLDGRTGLSVALQALAAAIGQDDLDAIEKRCQEIQSLVGEQPVFVVHEVDDRMIEVALRRKEAELALERIKQVRSTGRDDAELDQWEGDAYALLGDKRRAAECWRQALLATPSIELHEKLAGHVGDDDAEARDRHLGRAAFLKGVAEYRSNRLTTAITALEQATELNPSDPDPWYYLGLLRYYQRRFNDAQAAFEQCLSLRPEHGKASVMLDYLRSR